MAIIPPTIPRIPRTQGAENVNIKIFAWKVDLSEKFQLTLLKINKKKMLETSNLEFLVIENTKSAFPHKH